MLNRTNDEFKSKANLDDNSQLFVGCAIGVNKDYLERAENVIKAGCNILCIDVAHGHHELCGNAIKTISQSGKEDCSFNSIDFVLYNFARFLGSFLSAMNFIVMSSIHDNKGR